MSLQIVFVLSMLGPALHAQDLVTLDVDLRRDAGHALDLDAAGDTPLGRALKAGDRDRAEVLLRYVGPRHLAHRNVAGEGYVYLAARSGLPDLVSALAQQRYLTLGPLNRFNFSRLDQPTTEGRRALFVAANRAVAEQLEAQHWRGVLKGPWWDFMLARDKAGQNFVHAAARDGRVDVIRFAVDRACGRRAWEDAQRWFKRYPARVEAYGVRTLQTFVTGDFGAPWDTLINRTDAAGQTPVHVAVANARGDAVRALAHCRWTDFDLADREGDLPLHTFLKAVPRFTDEATAHADFAFLLAQDTRVRVFTRPKDRVNRRNLAGDTPLHLAATLADEFYYRQLAQVGDVLATDARGATAERLFLEHHAR